MPTDADDKSFVNAFVIASLTVSIGAMAVVGSIEDGISGDHTTLVIRASRKQHERKAGNSMGAGQAGNSAS